MDQALEQSQAMDLQVESPFSNRFDSRFSNRLNNRGFTLIEILVTMAILLTAVIPMLSAFHPVIEATRVQHEMAVFANQARATLNRVKTIRYRDLENNINDPVDLAVLFGSAAEASKERFTFGGTSYVPKVAISDASAGAGGLLLIRVTVEYVELMFVKADY